MNLMNYGILSKTAIHTYKVAMHTYHLWAKFYDLG